MMLKSRDGKGPTAGPFEVVGFAMGPGWSWFESERQEQQKVSSARVSEMTRMA